jgi:hypothetical protein
LEFDSNPLFAKIGEGPLATYRGAAIANFGVILIGAVILGAALFIIYKRKLNKKLYEYEQQQQQPKRSSSSSPSRDRLAKFKQQSYDAAIDAVRVPSMLGIVAITIAFPAVSAAFTIFTFDNEKSRADGTSRSDFDIVLAIPAVLVFGVFAGYVGWWTCSQLKKRNVKLCNVPPLEGSAEAKSFLEKKIKEHEELVASKMKKMSRDPRYKNSKTRGLLKREIEQKYPPPSDEKVEKFSSTQLFRLQNLAVVQSSLDGVGSRRSFHQTIRHHR